MAPSRNAPLYELTPEEQDAGLRVAKSMRVAVFVVAYNAESHIRETLRRIPSALLPHLASIYVIDDSSTDASTDVARSLRAEMPQLEVFTTPYNQGYGGNQKLGYLYAIERGYDVVVLLHGDGQYAPEVLPRILAPFADPETAAVFGSRMLVPGAARRGGMPFYKRVGNRVLTWAENKLLRADLSEFHSGYRAYRVSVLAELPFRYNTNDFHFDTEIIVQLLGSRRRIVEVPIPTYYGDEICHVNGIAYAFRCIGTVLRAKANRVYLVYHPKFDLTAAEPYTFKTAPTSVHHYVLNRDWAPQTRVLELGAGHGDVGRALCDQGVTVVGVDQARPDGDFPYPYLEHDLDNGFADQARDALGGSADVVLALDMIEHLKRPEHGLGEIGRVLAPGGKLVASTGNIAFILLRLMLSLGQFNYGKRGILDLTHKRLFTVRSFCRTLEGEGFEVLSVRGFGPPVEDMVSRSWPFRVLDRCASFMARVWPRMFSYQFVVEARRLDRLDDLLKRTVSDLEARERSERA